MLLVAEFIYPWLGDKVNSGAGLSYRAANYVAWRAGVDVIPQSGIYDYSATVLCILPNGANVFCFLSSLPLLPPPPHHGSIWVLPVISLLLANTETRCGLGYPYGGRGLVLWDQRRRRVWALSIQSSLILSHSPSLWYSVLLKLSAKTFLL